MSRLEEVVISTSIGKSGDTDEGGTRIWSPVSGQQYTSFSGNSSGKCGLTFVPSRRRQAGASLKTDYVVTAQVQKPLIKFWQWGREDVHMRCATPERMRVICTTPRSGSYLIGGGASGRLYIWNLVTGKLHRIWEGHYRAISGLQVSDDGSMLVSASEDATIQLWSLADVLDRTVAAASLHAIKPMRVWKGHSLPVTGIRISSTSTAAGLRVFSCSLDRSLKVWDVHASTAAVTFSCPDVLHALAVDPEERFLFVGGGGGDVFQANLELSGSLSDWLRRDAKPKHKFHAHDGAVTCLAMSLGGRQLVSGSVDKCVKVWDVATLQILQTFKGHDQHGPVSAVRFILRPRELFAKEKAENLLPLGRLSNFVDDEHSHTNAAAAVVSVRLRAQLPELDSGLADSSGNSSADGLSMTTSASTLAQRKRRRSAAALCVDLTVHGTVGSGVPIAGNAVSNDTDAAPEEKLQRLEEIHQSEMSEARSEAEQLNEKIRVLENLNTELQNMLGASLRADR